MVDFAEFKRFFLFNLIGALIISALVAVVTVLIGKFNEVTLKILWTLSMVIVHSLISLAFIWDDEKQKLSDNLAFFVNMSFLVIVISFVVSIFGIWGIISGSVVWDIYQTFFVVILSSLQGNLLSKASGKEGYLDLIVYANYLFIVVVALMFLPVIYVDNITKYLGEFYFRILGAVGIVDGTLTILAIIFYKLYKYKHKKNIV